MAQFAIWLDHIFIVIPGNDGFELYKYQMIIAFILTPLSIICYDIWYLYGHHKNLPKDQHGAVV